MTPRAPKPVQPSSIKPYAKNSACVACRSSKVRCVVSQYPPCKRCAKHSLPCSFVPSRRGQRPPKPNKDGTGEKPDPVNGDRESGPNSSMTNQANNHSLFFREESSSRIGLRSAVQDEEDYAHGHASDLDLGREEVDPISAFSRARNKLSSQARNLRMNPSATNVLETAAEVDTVPPMLKAYLDHRLIEDLFEIYFGRMLRHCQVLTPSQRDPREVVFRSSFLLVTICTVASNLHPGRASLQPRLCEILSGMLSEVIQTGQHSVEIVQALLLISVWVPPLGKEDRAWQILGLALRMCIQLDLHRARSLEPQGSTRVTEQALKKVRAWQVAFIQDRSVSAQMGKPTMLPENSMIRRINEWCQYDPVKVVINISHIELHLLLKPIIFRHGNSEDGGLALEDNLVAAAERFDRQVEDWRESVAYRSELPEISAIDRHFHNTMNTFFLHYYSLVTHKLALQWAKRFAIEQVGVSQSTAAFHASMALQTALEALDPRGYLETCPDNYFVFCSYSALSYLQLSSAGEKEATLIILDRLCQCFERISLHEKHAPAIYSKFLRSVIARSHDFICLNPDAAASTSNAPNVDQCGDEVETLQVENQVGAPHPEGSQSLSDYLDLLMCDGSDLDAILSRLGDF
ncbi:hypothetical protein IE53DRAFT_378489 [Violaceomyces palustris]|uniref:Uncharacterized protein n=1 Tax=Violaceomyces palustris TaxID=1673888 RepID=A0ACD0P1W8_9BASI|nr:hypothetical protein IE53DRAFT_378489 [Violaceomyces palustris]